MYYDIVKMLVTEGETMGLWELFVLSALFSAYLKCPKKIACQFKEKTKHLYSNYLVPKGQRLSLEAQHVLRAFFQANFLYSLNPQIIAAPH